MKQKKHLWRLGLMDPRNLAKEVHVYGYNFDWKTHLSLIVCSSLGIGAIGVVFRLNAVYFAVTVIAVVAMLPVFVLTMYKRMYEQKRFGDITTYLEQMLYAYQKEGKVLSALKETAMIFDSGQMREHIDRAITYIETGVSQTEKGFTAEGLAIIEEAYECIKIHTVHETLLNIDQYGGNVDGSIMLLLEDLEIWKRRGYKLQARKKQQHTDNIISIIVATALCAIALYVIDGMRDLFPTVAVSMSIMSLPLIQLTSFLLLLWELWVLAKSFRSMSSDWLQSGEVKDTEYLLHCYDKIRDYDAMTEKKKSLLWSSPFLIAAVIVFLMHRRGIALLLLVVGIICLFQHRMISKLAKEDVTNALYAAMPQWMIQMALLLQHNNVQVSIAKSMQSAPEILRPELQLLQERLSEHPESLAAYTDFCRDYDVPEVQSLMKMLHSIAEAGTGDANLQITNMLQRVQEMQQLSDQRQDESSRFKMQMVFLYPVFGATIKLMIDLTLGSVYMMSMLGNMGGV